MRYHQTGSLDDLEGGQSEEMLYYYGRILRSNSERSGTSLGRHDGESTRKRKETTLTEENNEQVTILSTKTSYTGNMPSNVSSHLK